MSIPGSALTFLSAASGGDAGYQISRSLRFNDDDSAYLNRTPSSAGNRRTFTWSGWVKRAGLTAWSHIYTQGPNPGSWDTIRFDNTNDKIYVSFNSNATVLQTDASFRDVSAWYHIVVAVDTTQTTSADRVKIYVNGVEQSVTGSYPTQNQELSINNTTEARIGLPTWNTTENLNGYLADVHFLDGLTPGTNTDDTDGSVTGIPNAKYLTDFGEFDDNGVWQPKEVSISSPNNGTVWSNVASGSALSGYPITNGFDGSTSTWFYAGASQTTTFTFSPAITGTKFEIYALSGGAWPEISVNGTGIGTHNSVWVDVSSQAGGSLSTIACPGASGSQSGFAAVRVDGVILVDGANEYGTNGFHLDFSDNSSNAALGTDSSGNNNNWTVNNLSSSTSVAVSKSSISYAIAPSDYQTGVSDQSSLSFNNTWTVGSNLTTSSFIIIDTGGVSDTVDITPFGSDALVSYSNDLINWTQSAVSTANNSYGEGRYYWIQSPPSGYGGGLTLTSASTPDGDSFIDTPTNYDDGTNVGGNYCTLNPLEKSSDVTLSNGNLDASYSGGTNWRSALGTFDISSGKWYFEFTLTEDRAQVGVCGNGTGRLGTYLETDSTAYVVQTNSGTFYTGSSGSVSTGLSFGVGDVVNIAYDADNTSIWIGKNGTWSGSGNPSAGTGAVYTSAGPGTTGRRMMPGISLYETSACNLNFGQRPFAISSIPTGYKSLCTQNLTDPTIADGSTAMDVLLWTGNGTSSRSVDLPISGDLVWAKKRSGVQSYQLADTVRGSNSVLKSNNTEGEADPVTGFGGGGISSISSTAFTISQGTSTNDNLNENSGTFVAWLWDAGANSNKTYTVKVLNNGGNKYYFDDFGTSAVTLDLEEGSTYVFDQSDVRNAAHPLRFATAADAAGGTEYTTGVTVTGTPGQAGAKTTITVASGAPTLYYYCSTHNGMGGQANTNSTAGASNFDGSIQSTVRANPSAGFSICTYTGSTGNQSFGHGLNAAPKFIAIKNRSNAANWFVMVDIGTTYLKYGHLNLTDAFADATAQSVSSSTVTLGNNNAWFGANGDNYVAYCFAPVEGYSAFGSYTGNGTSTNDGPFVYTGFRPRWLLLKHSTDAYHWYLFDSQRDPFNVTATALIPNENYSETADAANYGIDFLSNGFKLKQGNLRSNGDGVTYIYAAFAEHPFKTARAR